MLKREIEQAKNTEVFLSDWTPCLADFNAGFGIGIKGNETFTDEDFYDYLVTRDAFDGDDIPYIRRIFEDGFYLGSRVCSNYTPGSILVSGVTVYNVIFREVSDHIMRLSFSKDDYYAILNSSIRAIFRHYPGLVFDEVNPHLFNGDFIEEDSYSELAISAHAAIHRNISQNDFMAGFRCGITLQSQNVDDTRRAYDDYLREIRKITQNKVYFINWDIFNIGYQCSIDYIDSVVEMG